MRLLAIKTKFEAPDLLIFDVLIKGKTFRALIDSGAQGLFMSSRVLDQVNLQTVEKTSPDSVRLADGRSISSTHVARARFQLGTSRDIETFHILDLPEFDLILGKPWLRRINPRINWKKGTVTFRQEGRHVKLVPVYGKTEEVRSMAGLLMNSMEFRQAVKEGYETYLLHLRQVETADGVRIDSEVDTTDPTKQSQDAERQKIIQKILQKFEDVCPSDPDWKPPFPPERPVDHKIELVPGAKMPNRPIYRMSQPELEELRRQLDDLMERGYIRPSTSPYASPVLLVVKPGTGPGTDKPIKYRLVCDFRVINQYTIKNAYPVPPLHDLLDRLHGKKFFTKIDLTNGFWQVRMDPASIPLTAFRTRFGLFEWCVMAQGLCNSPPTFQRLMNDIITPLDEFAVVYLDDCLIFSDDWESHLQHVETVLKLFREHKLFAQPHKCDWGLTKIKFLGHYVSSEGIHVDPDKVKSILEWPTPKSKRDIL